MVANTYLPVRNGVTVSMAGWTHGLRELGHDVDVWTIATTDPRLAGVHAVPGFGEMAAGFPYPATLRAPAAVRERRYDVVHAHHPTVLGPPAAHFARRTGAAFVATAHSDYLGYIDDYAPASLHGPLSAVGVSMMRRFFDRCDLVLAPSSAIAATLGGWGCSAPVERCVYPVDARQLAPVPREQARAVLRVGSDTPLALYAGRVAAEKGLDELVAEFQAARDRAPGALLAIAGDGPRREHLRAVVERLGLSATVRFLGALEPVELGLWYAAADVHVSASPAEVGPLTVVEAAACATPSVGYRVSGFEDRIIDGVTGLLVERRTGALAVAMAALLSDRTRAAGMGRAAQEAAADNTPTAAAATLASSYQVARALR